MEKIVISVHPIIIKGVTEYVTTIVSSGHKTEKEALEAAENIQQALELLINNKYEK